MDRTKLHCTLYSTILPKNVIYVINILFKIGTQVFQATAQTSFKSDFHFVQSAPLIATEAESAFTIGFTAACSLWRPPLLAGGKRFTPAAAAASVSMFIYVNTRCPPQPNDCLHAWGTILPASGFYRSFSWFEIKFGADRYKILSEAAGKYI